MPSTDVHLLQARFSAPTPPGVWEACLARVHEEERARAARFLRWQDAHTFIGGRLLLRLAAKAWGCPVHVREDDYKRPYLEGCPDFNISHSDGWVALGWSSQGRIGLDVERLRPLAIHEVRQVFNDHEWATISTDSDPLRTFYHWWTLKEAVMKADGRGFHLSPLEITVGQDFATVGADVWHLRKVNLGAGWCVHLATAHPVAILKTEELTARRILDLLGPNS